MGRDIHATTEVDDYKNAISIALDMEGQTAASAFVIMAQWCATLREHYCEIGRQTAQMVD